MYLSLVVTALLLEKVQDCSVIMAETLTLLVVMAEAVLAVPHGPLDTRIADDYGDYNYDEYNNWANGNDEDYGIDYKGDSSDQDQDKSDSANKDNDSGDQDGSDSATEDYDSGDYEWEHEVEQRGESFWRTECREWGMDEVKPFKRNVIYLQ